MESEQAEDPQINDRSEDELAEHVKALRELGGGATREQVREAVRRTRESR